MNVKVKVDVDVSVPPASYVLGPHVLPPVPPSSPEGPVATHSVSPPPIPYSTHPRNSQNGSVSSQMPHVSVDVPGGLMSREEQDGHSDPPPIPVSTHPLRSQGGTTHVGFPAVAVGEGIHTNQSINTPPLQRPLSVTPTPPAAVWTVLSPGSPSHRRQSRNRYYAVTVGKRTGVFGDWSDVSALTQGVSMATQKGFPTYHAAVEYYERAKARGLVWVTGREDGDEVVFGPRAEAVQ